jgi:hypothetical protein
MMHNCNQVYACSTSTDPNCISTVDDIPDNCTPNTINGGGDQGKPVPPNPDPGPQTTKPASNPDTAACKRTLVAADSACDTSKANNFQNQVAPSNTGAYGITNGTQQISNVITNCKSAINDCTDACMITGMPQGLKDQCDGYNDNLASLQNAGNRAVNQAQNNAMNPSSMNPNNTPTPITPATTQKDCNNPVNNCGMNQQQPAAVNDAAGQKASMAAASAGHGIPNATGMNVGNTPLGPQNPQLQNANLNNQQQQPPMNPYGMMGGSSGSGFGAGNNSSPNAGVGGGPRPMGSASKGNITDILKGERSGQGGYTGARGIASIDNPRRGRGGAGFGGFNFGSVDDYGRMRGLDLKSYLPGGRQDPTRRVSGVNFAHPDVHGATENLFIAVTNRFQIHCKLQMLFDCR